MEKENEQRPSKKPCNRLSIDKTGEEDNWKCTLLCIAVRREMADSSKLKRR